MRLLRVRKNLALSTLENFKGIIKINTGYIEEELIKHIREKYLVSGFGTNIPYFCYLK